MASVNLGGLGDLNSRIGEAERLYFNLSPYIEQAAQTMAPDTGGQRDRDVKSFARGMNRGASKFTEARINALRQQRAGLNPGTDANIPYQAFDPKNLSSDANVYETPENIAARNGFGDTSGPNAPPGGSEYIYQSNDLHMGWYTMPNGAMVYTLLDPSGVAVLNQGNSATNAVNTQAQAVAGASEQDEINGAKGINDFITKDYTTAAKHAGTYADTQEFQRGLSSEISQGVQGAEKVALDRINALRAQRGATPLNEISDLNPQSTLGDAPVPGPAPATALAAPTTPGAPVAQTINTAPKPLVSSQPATVADNATGSAGPTTEDKPATGESTPATETATTAVKNDSNDLTSGKAINSRVSRMRALKTRSL